MLRTWAGIVDTTPDASPIVGATPVDGLWVNCGWGTGGFKATPGVGLGLRAHDRDGAPHPLNVPFSLERFAAAPSSTSTAPRRWRTDAMLLITCPHCGPRDETEFTYGGEAGIAYPADPDALTDAGVGGVPLRAREPQGPLAERWCHSSGCRRWFDVVRDTVTQDVS